VYYFEMCMPALLSLKPELSMSLDSSRL